MATTDLERLVVQMSLDIRKFEQSLAKANGTTTRELNKMERKFQASQKRIVGIFSSFGRGLLGGLAIGGVAAAGTALGRTLATAVEKAADVGDLADKLGITTDALQDLQFGAVQANLDFEELSKGLLRFSKATAEARAGQGDLAKILKANGVQLTDDYNQNLRILADLVKNAANEQDAFLIITQAFGRGGDEFLEFLRGGSAGLQQVSRDATEAGGKLEGAFIRTAQSIDDRWAALLLTMGRRVQEFVLTTVKEFQSIQDFFQNLRQEGFTLGGVQIIKPSLPPRPEPNLETIRGAPGSGTPRASTVIPTKAEEDALRDLNRERERAARLVERNAESFRDALTSQQERVDALKQETEIIGLNTQAQETARARLELMNAAMQNNIAITREVQANIDATAQAYGEAAAAFEAAQERMQFIVDLNAELKDSLSGFFSDIASGVKPVEALNDALRNLGQRLADLAVNAALNSILQTGAGGTPGGLLANLFHQGGVVGSGGSRRSVDPLAFIGAPRMHSGGIAGNEVPAILKRGEIVLPANMGSRQTEGLKVTVNNYGGSKVETRERSGSNGRRELEVIIDGRINNKLPTSLDRLMPAKFGVSQRLRQNG